MTDRELLELAAKVAGMPIYESTDGSLQRRPIWVMKCGGEMGTMPYEQEWNPLTDDGDALRLAVKLGLTIQHLVANEEVAVCSYSGFIEVFEFYLSDPDTATRRAIVRAAAEIGRNMP